MLIVIIVMGILLIVNFLILYAYCTYMAYRCGLKEDFNPSKTEEKIASKKKFSIKEFIVEWVQSLMRLTLFLLAYFPSHHIRNILYKHIFKMDIGKNVVIYYGAELRAPWKIHIGDGSIIGDKSLLDGRSGLFIGKNVNFSTGASIYTLQHNVNDALFSCEGEGKPVYICDRAWISSGVTILPGVTVGEGAVAATGAVVTKSIPPLEIWGGIPAKRIGQRNRDLKYKFDGKHLHFL